jgi:hypothetical protein
LAHAAVKFFFPGVREWWVPDIVGECKSFCEVFVQRQRNRNGTGNLRDFDGVGKPVAEMIGEPLAEYLSLTFKTAERTGVDDAVAVALELSPVWMRRLRIAPAPQFLIRKP